MLKIADARYQTAHFGKWDHRYDMLTPSEQGFDFSDGYTTNSTGGAKHSGGPAATPDPKLMDTITDEALHFITRNHANERPFYLQLSHYAVHLDVYYNASTLAEVKRKQSLGKKHNMPEFAAMTGDLDCAIGRILDKLVELDLLKETYLIFLSDNGGRTSIPKAPISAIDRNAPLRDGKHSFYEGGIRVPFFVLGPGVTPGAVCDVPVTGVDLFPTFAELAGCADKLPENIDGGSLRELLHNDGQGKVERSRPYLVFHQAVDRTPLSAIRSGDYKLVKTWRKEQLELFDLSRDLSEAEDLSEKLPVKAAELHSKLLEYLNQVDAAIPGPGDLEKQKEKKKRKKLKAAASSRDESKSVVASPKPPPNILFISVDDLNDWIGCMGGHPQTRTPNIDRLAASGTLFTNAHCPAPACNPSRTAIMTGISPHKSGLYSNRQKMRELLPAAELMPKYFSRHGYWSAGSGKILHYFIDAPSWDVYFPPKETEDPFPRTLYPSKRPVNLPVGGPWQYRETDWAPLDATDEEFGGDWLVSKWVGEQLRKKHDQPFFLACGIYRPHEPWFVPKKYFEPYPLEGIQLPLGYREDDLDDLPPEGKKRGPNRYFPHIRQHARWKQGVQGYLASIAFADAMVGRVLDALESGPNRDSTIVVLWSDHGWHLGEKQHWQKFTAWRVCTRVPLIIRAPAGVPGLKQGTKAGEVCSRPVNLLSLYSTLTDLTGMPPKKDVDGPSLVPLLEDTDSAWPHVSLTYLDTPGNYGLSDDRWRLIHYANGDEELYNIVDDPYEWSNLAEEPEHTELMAQLRSQAPKAFRKYVPPSDGALPKLVWHPVQTQTPASKPDGDPFDVVFTNQRADAVKLFWMNRSGEPKARGILQSGWRKPLQSRPGAVWLITDLRDSPHGYFQVGDRTAHAIIPAEKPGIER